MTRGFVWGYYVSDDTRTYALQVDADYFAMAERGWTGPAIPDTYVYPRGWTPRRVIGLDDRGKLQEAVVANVSADLWTGAETTFTINGTDEAPHTVTVIARKAERFRNRP
jgi:hypothetical protein